MKQQDTYAVFKGDRRIPDTEGIDFSCSLYAFHMTKEFLDLKCKTIHDPRLKQYQCRKIEVDPSPK